MNLRRFVRPGHVFLATFFEGDSSENPLRTHSHMTFRYSRSFLEEIGKATKWRPEYIGDWNHPRGQRLIRYVAIG